MAVVCLGPDLVSSCGIEAKIKVGLTDLLSCFIAREAKRFTKKNDSQSSHKVTAFVSGITVIPHKRMHV